MSPDDFAERLRHRASTQSDGLIGSAVARALREEADALQAPFETTLPPNAPEEPKTQATVSEHYALCDGSSCSECGHPLAGKRRR